MRSLTLLKSFTMPRHKKNFKKRTFSGNRYTKKKRSSCTPGLTASAKKIHLSEDKALEHMNSGNKIIVVCYRNKDIL